MERNTYTVKETECDANYNIRLAALWDLMQDTADQDASNLGYNHETMQANGNFFALIRMNIKVHKYPKAREQIIVESFPSGGHTVFCVRNYNVYDIDNNLLAESVSLWTIVDIKTGRPLRPSLAYPNEEKFQTPYNGEVPNKIRKISEGEFLRAFIAEFCDIDGNNHVNNSRYINWLENCIRVDKSLIKELNTNYISETKMGELLICSIKNNIFSMKDKEGNLKFLAEYK